MKDVTKDSTFNLVHQAIEHDGIVVTHRQQGFTVFNQDMVSPHLLLIYCHQGSSRVLYDMREYTYGKGELAIIMPEHVVNQLSCTDDLSSHASSFQQTSMRNPHPCIQL